MIYLYNTLAHKKEEFAPIKDKQVGFYTCGPTVYFYAHIGNMRTYINEDLARRMLEKQGYKVKHVMNITDVGHLVGDSNLGEDKIRMEAKKEKKTAAEVAAFYTRVFLNDLNLLNIKLPEILCKATEHIDVMIDLVKRLDEKGFLYKISTGMYFDTSKFPDYGHMANMDFEKLNKQIIAGARVERAEGIKNATDFAVWRFNDVEKEMVWESQWGRGFPGWHIECSAMSMHYLGETFDIHCGGVDHIPIHHTNEIAQSESATGKRFVNYWIHMNFLTVDGNKMSKSLHNDYNLEQILEKGHTPMGFRLFMLSGHYRKTLNFTFDALSDAEHTLSNIYNFLLRLKALRDEHKEGTDEKFAKFVNGQVSNFMDNLSNDLNVPAALPFLHDLMKETNKRLEAKDMSSASAETVISAMLEMDEILGLKFKEKLDEKQELSSEIQELIEERELARESKDFARADKLRKELLDKYNVVVEDTEEGVKWRAA